MIGGPIVGMPGFRTAKSAAHRIVFKSGQWDSDLPQGRIIDGSKSRDPGNTGNINVLRAGMLMGKITASGKYAPSFVGVTTGAYTSGGTELTVSAAQATELDRLVGQSGSSELVCIGPPSAAGTVAVTAFDHSAINTTTGVITCTSLGVNKVAASFIAVNDGRYTPLTVIPDGWGILVTEASDSSSNLDVSFPVFPIAGVLISENLLTSWPADTSLRTWIYTGLNTAGVFVRDDAY